MKKKLIGPMVIVAMLAFGFFISWADSSDSVDSSKATKPVEQTTTYEEPTTTPEVVEEEKTDPNEKYLYYDEYQLDQLAQTDYEEYLKAVDVITYHKKGKSAYEYVREKGWRYFAGTNWDGVFTYQSDVHYISDYNFRISYDYEDCYGYYVAYSSADIQNAYGAYINSCIYIYMSEWGDVTYVCYEESDGSLVELPIY